MITLFSSKKLVPLLGLLVLVGCEQKHDDLEQWVKEVEAKRPPPVKKLPEIVPYKGFDYAAMDKHSPFMKVVPEAIDTLVNLEDCAPDDPIPDVNRRKEPLEKVAIQTLSMVGSMEQRGEKTGIILDANTGIHHPVIKGQYLGLNHGKIVSLEETEIKLSEIIPNGKGCWESHIISLDLVQIKN